MASSVAESGPLTTDEKKLLVDSWKLVRQDLSQNGILLFVLFFTDHPQHSKYFKLTSIGNREAMEKDPVLKSHALRVMKEVTAIVDNLENTDVLLGALKQNANNHKKRSISHAAYDDLRTTMLKLFGQQLGVHFSKEAEAAWNKALTFLFKVITDTNDDKNAASK